MNKKGKKKKIY